MFFVYPCICLLFCFSASVFILGLFIYLFICFAEYLSVLFFSFLTVDLKSLFFLTREFFKILGGEFISLGKRKESALRFS